MSDVQATETTAAPAAPVDPAPAAGPVPTTAADPWVRQDAAAVPPAAPAAPVAELNPGVSWSPDALTAALTSAGEASVPVGHETLLQRAHDELDRIIHRISVGLDKGVEDLRALKSTIAAHLGL